MEHVHVCHGCAADAKGGGEEGKKRVRRPATCHPGARPRNGHGDPAVDRAWPQVPSGIADREKLRVPGVVVEPVWIGTAAIISNAIRPTGHAVDSSLSSISENVAWRGGIIANCLLQYPTVYGGNFSFCN